MSEQSNVEVVRSMYEAFGRGDIPAVLASIDDAMVFTVFGASSVPMAGTRRGVTGMEQFFAELANTIEFSSFDAHDYIAQGDRVVALVHYAGKNKNTGRPFDAESAMVWTIRNGKAVNFLEYTDTDQLARAGQTAGASGA
jgi:ketosteroid isomerase-like protein